MQKERERVACDEALGGAAARQGVPGKIGGADFDEQLVMMHDWRALGRGTVTCIRLLAATRQRRISSARAAAPSGRAPRARFAPVNKFSYLGPAEVPVVAIGLRGCQGNGAGPGSCWATRGRGGGGCPGGGRSIRRGHLAGEAKPQWSPRPRLSRLASATTMPLQRRPPSPNHGSPFDRTPSLSPATTASSQPSSSSSSASTSESPLSTPFEQLAIHDRALTHRPLACPDYKHPAADALCTHAHLEIALQSPNQDIDVEMFERMPQESSDRVQSRRSTPGSE